MKFWITKPVLDSPVQPGEGFRAGTLSGLIRLQSAGHLPVFDENALSTRQRTLLKGEEIPGNTLLKAHADYIIDLNHTELVVLDHDGEILKSAARWDNLLHWINEKRRVGEISRTTQETDISVKIDLDGSGKSSIHTGLPFFDHMLEQIARHGYVDLYLTCKGDLHVDEHHTIEDVGIALGEAISQALGDKKGIERYGFVLPMDEAQAVVALDLSGRPFLVFDGAFTREKVGAFPTEMTKHFFYSLAMALKGTLQISVTGENDHHKIEACFKGFARTLKQAVAGNPKAPDQIPSSKGML